MGKIGVLTMNLQYHMAKMETVTFTDCCGDDSGALKSADGTKNISIDYGGIFISMGLGF
ncbi:MAG: hypothetical protein HY547_00330 [Elusimicrobia bacterium]|nr:hypothetical protein [Elusimicrobiota bacterium]